MNSTLQTVISKDATCIAFNQTGKGPTLVLVSGAIQHRAFDQGLDQLTELLAPHFTVISYDRRGRGDSSDTEPYSVEREVEDIEALIDAAGGRAFLYGISSGAALAMEAAIKLGSKVEKLAMYEAPYNDEAVARQAWVDYRRKLDQTLAEGRRGDAVGLFMMLVGMPAEHLPGMRQSPLWPVFEAVAPTLAYDAAVLGKEASVPTERAVGVKVPALVMDGGASYPFMGVSAKALAKAMPHAQHRTLEDQTHEVAAQAIAPALVGFFKGEQT